MSHDPYPDTVPLDSRLYDSLDERDVIFLKSQTGIQDDVALREHVLQIQREAYAVHPYPCIRKFSFAIGDNIAGHPKYRHTLELGKMSKDAVLLDLGCCMGSDVRKAISDGFPMEGIITSDIVPEFWNLGHKLYKTTHDTFPVPFLAGNVFDDNFLSPTISPVLENSPPPLSTLYSLTPLQHHVSIIHISMVFHLFEEEERHRDLASRLALLLSPTPGSIIFGKHRALEDTHENRNGGLRFSDRGSWIFGHSPTSWENMWVGAGGIYRSEEAKVETMNTRVLSKNPTTPDDDFRTRLFIMHWSVTRI